MSTVRTRLVMVVAAALGVALVAGGAYAQTDYTWNGAANGDWFADANWTPTGVPGTSAGDTAFVGTTSILLTNSPGVLAAFTITNSATLTFSNVIATVDATTLTATNVFIHGTVTHVQNSATTTNLDGTWPIHGNVHIVCSNLTVGTAGKINVNALGYTGQLSADGRGPGGGKYAGSRGGGGGYGGLGGKGTASALGPAQKLLGGLRPLVRADGVVPVGEPVVSSEADILHLVVRDGYALGI